MLNLIPTTQAEHIAKKLRNQKDVNTIFLDKSKDGRRYFPDNEVYVRLAKVNEISGRTIVLHAGMPCPNKGLTELRMLLSILKENNISPLEVFFTYFTYGMQDQINRTGETCVAENIIKELLDYYGVKKIYIIDAHFSHREWVHKYPITNISVFEEISRRAKKDYPDIVFMVPDMGAQLRTGLNGTNKIRKNSFELDIATDDKFKQMVKGKIIGVVDDLIETGGTMVKFHEQCMNNGAKETIAVITHGVLEAGIKRLRKHYSKIYLTNTINRSEANIDISKDIIKVLI